MKIERVYAAFAAAVFISWATIIPSVHADPVADIEAAILNQEFEKAYELSGRFVQDFQDGQPIRKKWQVEYYRGLSALNLKRFEEAEKIFSMLTNEVNDRTLLDKVYLGLTDANYFQGDYAGALMAANTVIGFKPLSESCSLIYLKLGRINLRLAKWNEAREYLNRVVREFPQSPEVYSARQLLAEPQYFAVQVGSFLNQSRAERLVAELQERGEYAYIVQTTDEDGRTFFRVRTGKLSRLGDAQHLRSKLSRQGYPTLIYP